VGPRNQIIIRYGAHWRRLANTAIQRCGLTSHYFDHLLCVMYCAFDLSPYPRCNGRWRSLEKFVNIGDNSSTITLRKMQFSIYLRTK